MIHVYGVAAHICVMTGGGIGVVVVIVVVILIIVVVGVVVGVVVIVVVSVVISAAVIASVPCAVTVVGAAVVVDGTTMPIAVPTAVSPSITTAHHGADSQAGTEGENSGGDQGTGAVTRGHIRIAVHDSGVVFGNVDDLGIGGLDNDGLGCLLYHRDLWAGLEIACLLGLGAKGLDRGHYVGLLVVVGLAER